MRFDLDIRLSAVCDLAVASVRESAGRHEYDGLVQDLSPEAVRRGLARLGGPPAGDAHDDALVRAAEDALRAQLGELALHRVNPLWHLENLDLATYEREYAPEPERAAARLAHLRRWPEAVDVAVATLDRVPAPVAESTVGMAKGLLASLRPEDGEIGANAHAAIGRLVAHLEHVAVHGDPSGALGADALTLMLSAAESCEVDLGELAKAADAERDRMWRVLEDACARIDAKAPVATTVRAVRTSHPDATELLAAVRAVVAEVIEWTERTALVPYTDGECRVGLMPDSQRGRALAGMFWAAPGEPDGPSWFRVTPPDAGWPADKQEAWLANCFNDMVLPNIAIHEVAPGHFAHGRALRRAATPARRTLQSASFVEGWAHYCEELALEEGFRAGDPKHAAGVALDALRRVTRFACAIGVHTGALSVADAARKFTTDALLDGPAAMAEARRALFDPTYGRYTWGKLVIRELRDKARDRWGTAYSHARFHGALLESGAPPLGLLDTVVLG